LKNVIAARQQFGDECVEPSCKGQGYIDMTGDELQRTEDISKRGASTSTDIEASRYRTIQSKSYFEITV
jgi:hypothetical protein